MISSLHWKYFLAIDDDFGQLSRFVEPCSHNLNTYSLEMARLLMAATQECDVILKQLCVLHGNSTCKNEQEYRNHLIKNIKSIALIEINSPHFELSFIPFNNWNNNCTPDWWTGNNKVKHERQNHYNEANLNNVMNAISGLLVANIYLHKDSKNKIWLEPEPKYFFPILKSLTKSCVMNSEYDVPV